MWTPNGTHSEIDGRSIRCYAGQKYFQHGGRWRPVADISVTESGGQFSIVIDDEFAMFGARKRNRGALIRTENANGRFGHFVNAEAVEDDIDYDVTYSDGFQFVPGVGWLLGDTGVGIHMADWFQNHPGRVTLEPTRARLDTRGYTGEINLDPMTTSTPDFTLAKRGQIAQSGDPVAAWTLLTGGFVGPTYSNRSQFYAPPLLSGGVYYLSRGFAEFSDNILPDTEYSASLSLYSARSTDDSNSIPWQMYQCAALTGVHVDDYNLLTGATPTLIHTNAEVVTVADYHYAPIVFTVVSDSSGKITLGFKNWYDYTNTPPTGLFVYPEWRGAGYATPPGAEPVLTLTELGGTARRRTLTGVGILR